MPLRSTFLTLVLKLLPVLLFACTPEPRSREAERPAGADLSAIQSVLDAQVEAWNQGNIDAFMLTYWKSDSLRFASGGTVRRGWQETLARYEATYPDRDAMGRLTFEELSIRRFSPEWAMAFGRYRLQREEPLPHLTGLFTLILQNQSGNWTIVHDHTSAAE
jgi:ketosteroid isomerase-like protein